LRNNVEFIEEFKEGTKKKFEMTDLGLMKYSLVWKFCLRKFKITNCNPVSTTKFSKYKNRDLVYVSKYQDLI